MNIKYLDIPFLCSDVISLAHNGVLFLDELLEFPRGVLEALRQPMEDGAVTIARASASLRFPARFALVAAMNPCPCGHAGDAGTPCVCAAADVARYRGRLSGPLSDRIDLHVTVPSVPLARLATRGSDSSVELRTQVERARAIQRARYTHADACNARATGLWLDRRGAVDPAARSMLAVAGERLRLSARGYHRVLRVARTIADLEGAESVGSPHVAEAIGYRPRGSDVSPALALPA